MCGIGVNVPELVYGQIGQDRIRDVWINNPELVKLRQDLPEKLEGVCSTCFFKEICLGNCVAENYFMYGRLTAPTWFCQKAAEMGLFPLTRQQPIQEKGSLQDKTLQDKS
jgi:radical SAM protein with 4Fe4S-binding SPASM domain